MEFLKNILPPRLFEVTEKAGISVKEIMVFSIWDMKKLTNLKNEDILMLKNIVTQYCSPVCVAGDQLEVEEEIKLKTECIAIDNVLKGGFRRGTLTEIYGESGTGKTQVALQVAAHCGSNGSVFICTEDTFPIRRFKQIRQNICNTNTDCDNNIFIEHLTEAHELLSCIRVRLPKLLNTNKISLIILDSVAAPFRCEFINYVQRAEELKELGILLYKLAQEYKIVVICINQVTSSFDNSDDVLPSLGLVWSNMTCYKLKISKSTDFCFIRALDQDVNIRELKVVNAPDLPIAAAKFIITANGIENII